MKIVTVVDWLAELSTQMLDKEAELDTHKRILKNQIAKMWKCSGVI